MRKHAFVALIILVAAVIGGCGGSDTSSTVVASSNDSVKALDISNSISGKTLYSVSSTTSTTSYAFGAGTTTGTLAKDNVDGGTWTFNAATGEITIIHNLITMILKRIQVDASATTSEYWLMYDANANASNKIYRFYVDQTNGLTAADAYRTSITAPFGLTFPQFFMGGSVQGNPLAFTKATIDIIKVSTLSGSDIDTPAGHVDTKDLSPTKPSILYNHPTGITTDGKGNLYVADTANHVIRKISIIDANTTITSTIAGTGTAGSSDNSLGTSASFSSPQGITCDGSSLYVTDSGNATIRKIDLVDTNNPVSTLAGAVTTYGAVDSTTSGEDARFYTPVGITTDGTNLYVTDASYHTIRKIKIATVSGKTYSQAVTTLAGSPNSAGSTDGTGTDARFNVPNRITTDGSNLYVTDFNNHTIRQIVIATGATKTIAGAAGVGGSSLDGFGTAARFYYPSGIITDGTNLFITEFNDTSSSSPNYVNVIRKLDLSNNNEVTTIAGRASPDLTSVDTLKGSPRFSKPLDIVSNGVSLFVSNYSRGYTDDVTKLVYPSFNNIRQISP